MNYEFDCIEKIANELVLKTREGKANTDADDRVKAEAGRLEKVILQQLMDMTNKTQIVTYLRINLHKLVTIGDALYDPKREHNPDAEIILLLMEAIRKPLAIHVPDDLVLPLLFQKREQLKFDPAWMKIIEHLVVQDMAHELVTCIAYAFDRFKEKGKRLADWRYLKQLTSRIENWLSETPNDEAALIQTLIESGFNYMGFLAFCTRRLAVKIQDKPEAEATQVLTAALTRINGFAHSGLKFDRHKAAIKKELEKWIKLELQAIKEKNFINPMRLVRNLTVFEIAFWEKLQYDHDLYVEPNLKVFSVKLSKCFMTKGQHALSAPSVHSKLYTKELAVVRRMEGVLVKMLADVRLYLR
jgi:hypothetical protein